LLILKELTSAGSVHRMSHFAKLLLFFQEKSKRKMMQIKNYKRIKDCIDD